MDMLFVHDLAEARVGDHRQQAEGVELEALYEYAAVGTYDGIASLWHLPELFDEFTQGKTMEAKVARDFDCLEFVFQSRLYGSLMTPAEIAECERDLLKIRTDVGRRASQSMKNFPATIP